MIFFKKSSTPPPSLENEKIKSSGTYLCSDVLSQLKNDFKNKCYLCEQSDLVNINVEHLDPHEGDNEKKFDWNNLFWSCSHCNNTKLHIHKNILNCTIKEDLVETNIHYKIEPFPMKKAELTIIKDDEKTRNTVDLLISIYNGTTNLKLIESESIRKKLLLAIRDFQELLIDYYLNNLLNEAEKEKIKSKIIHQLRSSSEFTAFKRWIIRDSEDFMKDFQEFLEDV